MIALSYQLIDGKCLANAFSDYNQIILVIRLAGKTAATRFRNLMQIYWLMFKDVLKQKLKKIQAIKDVTIKIKCRKMAHPSKWHMD